MLIQFLDPTVRLVVPQVTIMEDATQLTKMKVTDLKKELKSRGLSVAGNKTELIERLQEALGSGGNVSLGQVEGDDEDFDEEEILGGEDMDAAELGKLTPQEEEAALGGNIRVRDEAALLEQPEKKKISLKRSEPPIPAPPTPVVEPETENDPPASQEGEKEQEEGVPAKKIIKLDSGTEKNAIETRAERFGIPMTEEARRLARAARFGTATNGATVNKKPAKLSMETGGTDVEKLKARAERFGEVTSKSLAKVSELEKLKVRQERFTAPAGEEAEVEAEAGVEAEAEAEAEETKTTVEETKTTVEETKTTTEKTLITSLDTPAPAAKVAISAPAPDNNEDAIKKKRAERFGAQ